MGWAKFDDQFTRHPKVIAAGPWAELLAMRGVIYAAGLETDGFIPTAGLAHIGAGIPAVKKKAAALVEVGLWEESDGGWVIHDFLDYHPARAAKEEERAKARERMREVRANSNGSARNPDPTPTRTPNTTTAEDGFTAFNAKRAVEAVRQRKNQGLPVKSEGGLARTIQADADHIAESQRLWAHRNCENCSGKGSTRAYAPGAGMVETLCVAGDV